MHERVADCQARVSGADPQPGVPHQHGSHSLGVRNHIRNWRVIRPAGQRPEAHRGRLQRSSPGRKRRRGDVAQRDRDRSDSQSRDSSGKSQLKVEVKVIQSPDDLKELNRRVGAEAVGRLLVAGCKARRSAAGSDLCIRRFRRCIRQQSHAKRDRPRAGSRGAGEARCYESRPRRAAEQRGSEDGADQGRPGCRRRTPGRVSPAPMPWLFCSISR